MRVDIMYTRLSFTTYLIYVKISFDIDTVYLSVNCNSWNFIELLGKVCQNERKKNKIYILGLLSITWMRAYSWSPVDWSHIILNAILRVRYNTIYTEYK